MLRTSSSARCSISSDWQRPGMNRLKRAWEQEFLGSLRRACFDSSGSRDHQHMVARARRTAGPCAILLSVQVRHLLGQHPGGRHGPRAHRSGGAGTGRCCQAATL